MGQRYSFATILVGKNSLRREGIARVLRCAHFRILASLSYADELPNCKLQSCELLLLNVRSEDDSTSSIEHIQLFKNRYPDGRVAVVADRYRLDELVSAVRAGATGYFVDAMNCDDFIKSLELVMMGEAVFPPAFLSFALQADSAASDHVGARSDSETTIDASSDGIAQQLSPREKSILGCLIEGDSNKCIARKIDLAEATVKVHIKAILRKIRVQNRTQAAIWGMNNRSMAGSISGGPLQLSSGSTKCPEANFTCELPEFKRIEAPLAPASINRTHVSVGHANTPIVGLSANGSTRLRK
jgi:DNA-binding NarL/FixJ family response regulator